MSFGVSLQWITSNEPNHVISNECEKSLKKDLSGLAVRDDINKFRGQNLIVSIQILLTIDTVPEFSKDFKIFTLSLVP